MSYWTGMPSTSGNFYRTHPDANIVWTNGVYDVVSIDYRIALLKGDLTLGEIYADDGFKKNYNSDGAKWVEKIRKKDLKKIESIKRKIEDAKKDIEIIENIWK